MQNIKIMNVVLQDSAASAAISRRLDYYGISRPDPGALLLRTRGHGKPYQRTAAGLVCRPHQLPLLVSQSIPAVIVFPRLHLIGNYTPCCAARHGTGARLCEYITPEINQKSVLSSCATPVVFAFCSQAIETVLSCCSQANPWIARFILFNRLLPHKIATRGQVTPYNREMTS